MPQTERKYGGLAAWGSLNQKREKNATPNEHCAQTISVTGWNSFRIDESVYSGSADTGSNFRISSCQYVYNLSTNALGVGTYRADIKINGTVVGSAIFQLK